MGLGGSGDNHDRLLTRLLGGEARIPVHLYLACSDDEPGLQATLWALRQRLGAAAVSQRAGVWLRDSPQVGAQASAWQAARIALADRDVPSLLMALTPREVIAHGLPVARLDTLRLAIGLDGDGPADERAVLEQALQWCACAPAPEGQGR